jgi:hypothetical protein
MLLETSSVVDEASDEGIDVSRLAASHLPLTSWRVGCGPSSSVPSAKVLMVYVTTSGMLLPLSGTENVTLASHAMEGVGLGAELLACCSEIVAQERWYTRRWKFLIAACISESIVDELWC